MVDVVNVKYRPDRAVVQVSGVIEEEMTLPLVAVLKQLHFEFHYVHIELEVSSPGGQVPALTYLVAAMDDLRDKGGVRFTTRALLNCASAAAHLVSLGDYREASLNATFLYHQVRALGMEVVTVQSARQLLSDADAIDGGFIDRLVRRARHSRPARPAPGLQDFAGSDWRTIVYLLVGTGAADTLPTGKKTNRRQLLTQLRRHVAACLKDGNDAPLTRLYRKLFELDTPISAALALSLRLVDAIPELAPRAEKSMVPADVLTIPEWAPLYRPDGQVPRSILCRHTLVLGETGSGKTLSGVLPVVGAVMAPGNQSVGCALVIDPKREIKAHVADMRHDGLDVHFIDVHRAAKRPVMNLMAGELAAEVDADLKQDRFLDAARRILVRAASLSPASPARVLAGLPGNRRDSYWESEGSRLAQTLLALVLLLLKNRFRIYGGDRAGGWWQLEDVETRQALLDFGDAAGVVRRDPAVIELAQRMHERMAVADDLMGMMHRRAAKAAEQASQGAQADATAPPKDTGQDGAAQPDSDGGGAADEDPPAPADEPVCDADRTFCETTLDHIREFTGALTGTGLYRSSACFRQRVKYALEDAREILSPETDEARRLSADPDYCRDCARELAEESRKAAVSALPDPEARPGPNALALANSTLSWFNAGKRKSEPMLVESVVASSKKYLMGGDADEIYRKLSAWIPMAKVSDAVTYLAIAGFSRNCFADFADGAAANTLYFGVEPYYRALAEHGRDGVLVDFNAAVNDENRRRVYVFQPRLDDNEALLARALKAAWFEAILSSRKRQARGGEMPLAAYIADEFHRFVTANKSHGEQSFLDTCRSFGVFCVLACQSISSLEHALSEGSDRWEMNRSALSIILNNTANKLFFRSTDEALQACIDRLCPVTPELGRVTTFRPPSTLQPGECYASLADGRFERRQLLPFGARPDKQAGNPSNEVIELRSLR